MKKPEVFVIDFGEKSVRKIAFTNSKREADRIVEKMGMHIFFPSELANFEVESPIFVLADC